MVNQGSTMIKTLPDHSQPWSLTMVQPCSSPRGVDLNVRYLTMIDHGHLIFEFGTDHGCLTIVNHGWQWWPLNLTMVKTLPDYG